jgi:FixJ family two-component response regulator
MAENKHRVFIVDDDNAVRTGLTRLLHSAGYQAESFASAAEFLQRKPYDGNACLVLDVRMPGISGTELQKKLNEIDKDLPVIFLTAHGDVPMGVEAMKRGAEDFLEKPVDEIVLLEAVSKALRKHESINDECTKRAKARSSINTLTSREREILHYILGGATNREIAEFFGISEKTVKAHRGKVMQKAGASSAAELGWICSSAKIKPKRI